MSWNVAAPSASLAVSFSVLNQMSVVSEPAAISTSLLSPRGVSPMSPVWVTLITISREGRVPILPAFHHQSYVVSLVV